MIENIVKMENKWKKFWEEHPEFYRADEGEGEKKYVLVEFPYPSGSGLHVGHAFSFTGGDVYARYQRMKGGKVMFPMGWDAFGLPTENYAIKTKRKPQEVTKENTDMFRKQMKDLAFSFDWEREIDTTDPKYYKWTQWIFIKLFEKGLAYKEEMPINWCPSCKIGLANEEVVDNKCERCGAEVSKRNISQWVVKITDYADKLISGLEKTDFIDKVKQAQINWIGKSEGARVKFKVKRIDDYIEVFTTRPDTLFGASFMVVAPEHPFVGKLKERVGQAKWKEVEEYIKKARSKSDLERTDLSKDKTGVFSGLTAINPVNGSEIEIWISDFVLGSYGTGAIMSVPGHDQRDWDFAKKYGLDIYPVIFPKNLKEYTGDNEDVFADESFFYEVSKEKPYTEAVGVLRASEEWNGWEVPRDFGKVLDWIEEKGIGERASSYHIRDWIFSRQHYWGEPIPMVKCEKCGWVPVKESELPVVLPEVEAYEPTDDGKSPLSKIESFVKTTCPQCGGEAERETDTMPNWAGSDWYFLRYLDVDNDTVLASKESMKKWLPVDVYIGGDEHNTLHLLYSRFIYQFLHDIGAVPEETVEPYYRRLSHGVILGNDNQRMSKSKGNVIVPEVVADKYGVDAVRMYLMFMGPFDGTMAWNEKTLMGVKRFLDRWDKFMEIKQKNASPASNYNVKVIINKLISGVEKDLSGFKFNTVVAKMMEALNALSEEKEVAIDELKVFAQIMAPMAPYRAEEWWSRLRKEDDSISVHVSKWPEVDKKYLIEETVKLAVAVNGKVREVLEVDIDIAENESEVIKIAKMSAGVSKWLEGKEILKEIYVKGRMLNFVVRA